MHACNYFHFILQSDEMAPLSYKYKKFKHYEKTRNPVVSFLY